MVPKNWDAEPEWDDKPKQKKEDTMEGKVVRIVPGKNFGFIKANEIDYFFHSSGFDGHWSDLVFDMENGKNIVVTFEPTQTDKGARAENVVRLDLGIPLD